jgi:DNA topoisomerase-1
VRRESRRFHPTETGFLVNDLLVKHFPDLINVDFTMQMESQLDDVAEGKRNWVALMREFYEPFAKTLARAEVAIPKVEQIEYVGRECPKCDDGQLIIRWGRFGKFVGCSNFPKCRYTEPWLEKIGVKCPQCDDGEIVKKRTKKGRTFYGCSNWPTCEFTSWKRPLPTPCPACSGTLVIARKDVAKCLNCGETFAFDALALEESEKVPG